MTRGLSGGFTTEMVKGQVTPIILFEAYFASGYFRVHSGYGDITFNSSTFTGIGDLGAIVVQETSEVKAGSVTFTLSGIPSGNMSLILNQARQGNSVKCWFGFLDASGAIISTPDQIYSGLMDVCSYTISEKTATISLKTTNRLAKLEEPVEMNYTDAQQQSRFTGDNFFVYVPSIQSKQITFGN